MRFAFYGDDFTGSVDALLQFRHAGLRGVLVTSTAALAATELNGVDVVGLAGVARSLPTAALRDEVVPALRALLRVAPDVVQYKACSTADSSPSVGSLGRVLGLARELLPHQTIPVCFAQPDFGRYTFFGHHFARDHGIVYRLDRQPTMRAHPVTPATESDLRCLLNAQTDLTLGSLFWPDYASPDTVRHALRRDDIAALVCDAFTDQHLDLLAEAILADEPRPRFVLGSGGLSAALGRSAASPHRLPPLPRQTASATETTLVLNGSGSARTAQQVARAAQHGWPVLDLFAAQTADEAASLCSHAPGVIVTSAQAAQDHAGDPIDIRLARVAARCLDRTPAARLVICGGDTSGRVLRHLGVTALAVDAAPWGNVAFCRARREGADDLAVVLKGGQMGHEDLFMDILRGRSSDAAWADLEAGS